MNKTFKQISSEDDDGNSVTLREIKITQNDNNRSLLGHCFHPSPEEDDENNEEVISDETSNDDEDDENDDRRSIIKVSDYNASEDNNDENFQPESLEQKLDAMIDQAYDSDGEEEEVSEETKSDMEQGIEYNEQERNPYLKKLLIKAEFDDNLVDKRQDDNFYYFKFNANGVSRCEIVEKPESIINYKEDTNTYANVLKTEIRSYKIDSFFNGTDDFKEYKRKYNIPKRTKVVFYIKNEEPNKKWYQFWKKDRDMFDFMRELDEEEKRKPVQIT